MSKTKKRFETSQSIQRRIDADLERVATLRKEGHAHDAAALALRPQSETSKEAYDRFWWHVNERERCFKSAERIESTTIPKLGRKLAEFNTMILPGLGDDRSVSAR